MGFNLVNVNQILISQKFKHNDTRFKYFSGYKDDNFIRLLCIILPKMSRYIKYFDNGGKNVSFKIKDDNVRVKYNEIWNKIKKALHIKFHSEAIDDKEYIKAKVKAKEK